MNLDNFHNVPTTERPQASESSSKELYSEGMMGMASDSTTVKFLLDHSTPLAWFSEYLSGEMFDESTQTWQQVGKPLCNSEGRRRIMQEMYVHCNHMFEIANIDKEQVGKMAIDFGNEIGIILETNKVKYEINDYDVAPLVKTMTRVYYITLVKSESGNMQQFLRNNFKVVETQSRQRNGMLSGLLKRNE